MLISDLQLFNKFADSVGNRYLAASYISYAARKFAEKLPKYIIESYLIHWVLTGEDPKNIRARMPESSDVRHMNELLCYVCDDKVCDAVREMYRNSIKHRHLVYESNQDLNKYQADRATILLRMIWFHFE